MSGWQRLDVATIEPLCVRPEMSLGDAMARLKKTAMRILLVVEPSRQLLGTLTDSDIRRAREARSSLPGGQVLPPSVYAGPSSSADSTLLGRQ